MEKEKSWTMALRGCAALSGAPVQSSVAATSARKCGGTISMAHHQTWIEDGIVCDWTSRVGSAKTDPVRFKWGFGEGLLKDRFAFFGAYENLVP